MHFSTKELARFNLDETLQGKKKSDHGKIQHEKFQLQALNLEQKH